MPELHKNYSKTTTVPTAILPCYVILHSGNWKTASMLTEKSKEAHQEILSRDPLALYLNLAPAVA